MSWHAYDFAQGGTLYKLLSDVADRQGREAALAVHDAWAYSDIPRDQLIQAESALRGAFQTYSELAEPGGMRKFLIYAAYWGQEPVSKALVNAAATALFAAEVTRQAGNRTMSRTWLERANDMLVRYRKYADPEAYMTAHRTTMPIRYNRQGEMIAPFIGFAAARQRFQENCFELETIYLEGLNRLQ